MQLSEVAGMIFFAANKNVKFPSPHNLAKQRQLQSEVVFCVISQLLFEVKIFKVISCAVELKPLLYLE